ncbi:hypothetical protein ACFSTC_47030 [Nonomuraea ferruginea]
MRLRALDLLRERSLGEYGLRLRRAPGIAVFEEVRPQPGHRAGLEGPATTRTARLSPS